MATILPFETRDAREMRLAQDTGDAPILSTEERARKYREHTMTICRDLLAYYKRHAEWSPECETLMVTAVRNLSTICNHLATHPIQSSTKDTVQ